MNLSIIDVSGWTYRHYWGGAKIVRADGTPTGAVNGTVSALWSLIRNNPTNICAVFDESSRNWRHDIDPTYKANREPPPQDLTLQKPLIRRAIETFDIACVGAVGFEADDVIATLAKQALADGLDVTIISSDKDLMQLISEHDEIPGIRMYDPLSQAMIGPAQVLAKFGVKPSQMGDLLALMGDTSDNIKGVPKIGPKIGAKMLNTIGDLDAILAAALVLDKRLTDGQQINLTACAAQARVSRRLVQLKDDCVMPFATGMYRLNKPNPAKVAAFLDEMELITLKKQIFGEEQAAA